MFNKKNKLPLLPPALLVIIFFIGIFGYIKIKNWMKEFTPEKFLNLPFVSEQIKDKLDERGLQIFSLIPDLLGFKETKTYLIFFLNNTELRPGGGFIGSYAVVEAERGKLDMKLVEGIEKLDFQAPDDWVVKPPDPISKYLKVEKWYLRDSNWSPDFNVNAKLALDFYKQEGGILADEIDGVIGITTDVLEDLLEINGPVVVDGVEFNSSDVVEKLEYDVHYGFADRGIDWKERKSILDPFMKKMIEMIEGDFIGNFNKYVSLLEKISAEKHLVFYLKDDLLNDKIKNLNLSGEINKCDGDFLLWVDANLNAMKTDYAVERNVEYSFKKQESSDYLVSTSMEYNHTGEFDWRTGRYLSYVRIFVPLGSELVSTSGLVNWDNNSSSKIDQGQELDKQWFGVYVTIEPGEMEKITFNYLLSEDIKKQIDNGLYNLCVQKQTGTKAHGLTLELNFDKNIVSANPAELEENWGNSVYTYKTDLRVDHDFSISF